MYIPIHFFLTFFIVVIFFAGYVTDANRKQKSKLKNRLREKEYEADKLFGQKQIICLKLQSKLKEAYQLYIEKARIVYLQHDLSLELTNKILYILIDLELAHIDRADIPLMEIYGYLFNEGIVDGFNVILNEKIKGINHSSDLNQRYFHIAKDVKSFNLEYFCNKVLRDIRRTPDPKSGGGSFMMCG